MRLDGSESYNRLNGYVSESMTWESPSIRGFKKNGSGFHLLWHHSVEVGTYATLAKVL